MPSKPSTNPKAPIHAEVTNIPLTFEANWGQADPAVKFLSHSYGHEVQLFRGGEVAIELSRAQVQVPSAGFERTALNKAARIEIRLQGSDPQAQATAGDLQIAESNYFLGRDPSGWHTKIPNYGRVSYDGVYPGIDLVYYGNQRHLEHDFVIAPGADPSRIVFSVDGASLQIDAPTGDLVLSTAQGEIRLLKPASYQEIHGKRVEIPSSYELLAGNRVAFEIGSYNRHRRLVIDPELSYSTYLYGSNGAALAPSCIAVDSTGSTYVAGATGLNMDGLGVMKLSPGGSRLLYYTQFGPAGGVSEYAAAKGIAVDKTGAVYITGYTTAPDFPTLNAYQKTLKSELGNAFVTKLSPDGSSLVYSTYLGGSGDLGGSHSDHGAAIALDAQGHAFVTGFTTSSDFPIVHPLQAKAKGTADAFVTEFSVAGSLLLFSTYLGGSNSSGGTGIALDAKGDVFVTGTTFSSDFPTHNPFQASPKSPYGSVFVTALAPYGAKYLYSTYLGGSNGESGNAIAADSSGHAYVTGSTASTDFPVTPGAFVTSGGGAFVAKFNADGSALDYATYLKGHGPAEAVGTVPTGIAVDQDGRAIVGGYTDDESFPVTPDAFQPQDASILCAGTQAFLTSFDPAGATLEYSTYLGGSGEDEEVCAIAEYEADGLAVDSVGNAYLSGNAGWGGFPTTQYALSPSGHNGGGFVAKFALGQFTKTSTTIAATPNSLDAEVTFTAMVASIDSNTVPTGQVGFMVDGVLAADVSIDSSGQAVFTTSSLSKGSHKVEAVYSGTLTFDASTATVAVTTEGQTSAPRFSPGSSTFYGPKSVTIVDDTGGAAIFYTTNGTTPSTSSTRYSGAITVSKTETIEAIATAPNHFQSGVSTAQYTFKILTPAATPVFGLPAGTYFGSRTVKITDTTPGATIYYALHGVVPTTSSTKYTGPITVSASETIQAIAVADGYGPSAIAAAKYIISSN